MLISNKTFEKFRHYMTNGRNYIIPERSNEWDDLCFYCLGNGPARFAMQEYIYRIVKVLDCTEGPIDDKLMAMFDDGVLPQKEWEVVALEVAKFSTRGEEFLRASKRPLSEKAKQQAEDIIKENNSFPSQSGDVKLSTRKIRK
jgi:hypothetical protein